MRVEGDWLRHPGTQSLCLVLNEAGHQALFVGGCVRNALMGVAVNDVDIATDALPESVSSLAENAGFKVVPTGIDHGTVTVIAQGVPHEVTTFRQDVETDGRRAIVRFSIDVATDAARRDFTMNALYAQPDGEVVDPLGGLPDLQARRVRFVGDASKRIAEDYLRILRFFRFFAWYGGPENGVDAEGLAACAANSAGLETLSRERVGVELCKLLSAPDPSIAVASMAQAGVLAVALPGADARVLPILVHFGVTSWIARLAVMGGTVETLRLSRPDLAKIMLIRTEIGNLSGPAELGYRHGLEVSEAVILGRAAMFEAAPPHNWQAQAQLGSRAQLPISAADLMPLLQGKALGDQLRALEARWIASNFTLTKADLLR